MFRRFKGFTLIELLVVISIIALLIGILLPALGAARRTANQMKNSTQVRSIIQGMVVFAQSNQQFYPGLDSGGGVLLSTSAALTTNASNPPISTGNARTGGSTAARLGLLINGNFFTPETAVAPGETQGIAKWPKAGLQTTGSAITGGTTGNVSYALLQITDNPNDASGTHGGRRAEWRETSNSQAVVVSDRQIVNGTGFKSNWTSPSNNQTDWRGSVGFNDAHVEFLQHWENNIATRYGSTTNPAGSNTGDNLFDITNSTTSITNTANNAMMVFEMTESTFGS